MLFVQTLIKQESVILQILTDSGLNASLFFMAKEFAKQLFCLFITVAKRWKNLMKRWQNTGVELHTHGNRGKGNNTKLAPNSVTDIAKFINNLAYWPYLQSFWRYSASKNGLTLKSVFGVRSIDHV